MNFELQEIVAKLLKKDKIEDAILLLENKLSEAKSEIFSSFKSQTLTHLAADISDYLENAYVAFCKSYKDDFSIAQPKCMYLEMNGFTINYDLWFASVFGYRKKGGLSDLDWLADFDFSLEEDIVISGFEPMQSVYKEYMEAELWQNENDSDAADIAELLIILRFQEAVQAAYRFALTQNLGWPKCPVLATAHDYDLIYKTC